MSVIVQEMVKMFGLEDVNECYATTMCKRAQNGINNKMCENGNDVCVQVEEMMTICESERMGTTYVQMCG